ncbi:MAG: hypothetical protein Fur0015_01430 [Ignavibacteriales bacterium]
MVIRNEFFRARRNTIDFFTNYIPSKLKNIQIAEFERTFKYSFVEFDLIVVFKGNESNILLIQNGEIKSSFKKIKEGSTIKNFINSLQFFRPYEIVEKVDNISTSKSVTKKEYPFLSTLIINELKARQTNDTPEQELLKIIFKEIIKNEIGIYYSPLYSKIIFCPISYSIKNDSKLLSKKFGNYNEALREYLFQAEHYKKELELRKKIEMHFLKEGDYLSTTLTKLKTRIDSGSKSEEYYKIGNLLVSNYHLIKAGTDSLKLVDEAGNDLIVKLNKELTVSENVNYYFEKAKDEIKNYKKSQQLYNHYLQKYELLKVAKEKYLAAKNFDEVQEIFNFLKLNKDEKAHSKINRDMRFREFLLNDKYSVYVGKDSKSNDELSLKFAQKNDYWFHARGVAGSHVVLRNNSKETMPKDVIKKVAAVAAFYSKAKTAGLVPVSYTFAKYVVKRKGMESGQVQIANEKVVIVKPLIPDDCKQIGSENEI